MKNTLSTNQYVASGVKNIFSSNKIRLQISLIIYLLLAWLPINKPNIDYLIWGNKIKVSEIIWINNADASSWFNSISWKNQVINNTLKEWNISKIIASQITDVINLDNWIFALMDKNNVRCYVLYNWEMFLNLYDIKSLDGFRDGHIQNIAWYKEILISVNNKSKIELNSKLFGYCWYICKTPYVLCLDTSKIRFALIENSTNKEITQDNKLEYFIAQCNIFRTYAMSQLSQIIPKKQWDKGYRINIPELVSATFHFKIMRPKHLKDLVDKKRIDDITYKRLITKYFIKDWLLHEMVNDVFYKKISNHFWDPITTEEINQYISCWWLDKKTWEKLKNKIRQ